MELVCKQVHIIFLSQINKQDITSACSVPIFDFFQLYICPHSKAQSQEIQKIVILDSHTKNSKIIVMI